MQIPDAHHSIAALIDKHFEAQAEPPRPHMGCSQLGHSCDRWLWLSFRWAVQPSFAGRILRLFRRGHAEEASIVSDLRAIGMDVRGTSGQQARVDFGSHVSGSVDAIIESGVPHAPKTKAILECKTHSDKSFKELKTKGVKEAKPMHWIQCCVYGYGAKIDRALYFAVNKNTDEIYTEWLHLDKEIAENAIARGHRIAISDRIPEPLSNDETWYECRFCAGHDFCFGSKTTKHVNCRTCAHSTAMPDSTWHCARYDASDIPVDYQREGCECHVLHPDLVPWPRKDGLDDWTAIYVIDGRDTANGEGDAHIYTSRELLANPKACSLNDEYVAELRQQFGARIVE